MSDKEYFNLQTKRNTHIGRYLIQLNRSFITASLAYLQAQGFESVTPHHIRIIAQIDVQGTSVSKVLARSSVTKQSLSNTLAVLESNGLIQRVVGENDGRSRQIEFTQKGIELLQAGIVAADKVEAQYADLLGKKRFQDLKQTLGELHRRIISE